MLAAKKLGGLANTSARGDPRIVRALLLGLEDRAPLVRAMCIRSLAEHGARDALPALRQLARYDPDRAVRRQAKRARKRIARAPPPAPRRAPAPLRIELGRVSLGTGRALAPRARDALRTRLSNAVEDRIEPHRPALIPRESANMRIDVSVERQTAGRQVRYEVRVVLLELPKAHLRHTAKAVARADLSGRTKPSLETRVALQAVEAAVADVLETAIASD